MTVHLCPSSVAVVIVVAIVVDAVVVLQAGLIVDMPLSRTRSLLANINTSTATTAQPPDTASYSSHFSDTQVNMVKRVDVGLQ